MNKIWNIMVVLMSVVLELTGLDCLPAKVWEALPYVTLPPAAGCQPVWSDWDSVQDGGLFVSAQLLQSIFCSSECLNEAVLQFSWVCWETAVQKEQTAGQRWADGIDTNTLRTQCSFFSVYCSLNMHLWEWPLSKDQHLYFVQTYATEQWTLTFAIKTLWSWKILRDLRQKFFWSGFRLRSASSSLHWKSSERCTGL